MATQNITAKYIGQTNNDYTNDLEYELILNDLEIRKPDGSGTINYITSTNLLANWDVTTQVLLSLAPHND